MKTLLLLVALCPALVWGDISCNFEPWRDSKVCRHETSSMGVSEAELKAAEDEIAKVSCVTFHDADEATCTDSGKITVTGEKGCYATIGHADSSKLNLEAKCDRQGVIIHELLHNLGRFHEQSRHDRDDYVKVETANIVAGMEGNFDKCDSSQELYGTEYDYESIMHYGLKYFTTDQSLQTLSLTNEMYNSRVGVQQVMSPKDVIFLNKMYGCYAQENVDHSICENGGALQHDGKCYCVFPYSGDKCEEAVSTSKYYKSGVTVDVMEEVFTGTPKTFTLKTNNGKYPTNYRAVYAFQCQDKTKTAQATFTHFDIEGYECYYDRLKIYIGIGSVNPFMKACEKDLHDKTVKSTDYHMVLDMYSEEAYTFAGFTAELECV